ncbi:hypothetical protein [Streptomyces sp. NPDC055105]|uniref:hypothetical protein n=1 Tax=Streptomyces sp. NPDC055105 TaxID=3365719 RepID=UPI0037D86ADB
MPDTRTCWHCGCCRGIIEMLVVKVLVVPHMSKAEWDAAMLCGQRAFSGTTLETGAGSCRLAGSRARAGGSAVAC